MPHTKANVNKLDALSGTNGEDGTKGETNKDWQV